ncbi:NAD(P)-dependent oxidoreductase [Legionella worsleiensis]|uniref:D-isomer specific 2-hydroxyacid dehydrogenase n=1 Tax=Legionella worsleiensis TaxID=45076 RepID=A0A0W1AJH2_9GAMM|nr:NAD(P)-dependent oxidoreductase [Legionella worsleiensis]KTD81433.1 D-isomer specific 2-hydroxyacid dehydrogenase [Legionella worsleiensis]STY30132.1 D-isomer specific 2-hydroxyacid dehydrogenase [Legionella worsleiensis]
MRSTVFLTNQFIKPIISLLDPEWHVLCAWEKNCSRDLTKVSALATTVWDVIDDVFLLQFPNLKFISHLGIGTDNIDKNYLKKHQITLLSQPHSGVHDTAELALALMLTLSRKILTNDQYTRNNDWINNKPKYIGNHLSGKQLGLVGLGQIGLTIARFAEALNMTISYTARSKKECSYQFESDIRTLASKSDFLIICCSANEQSHHLVNKAVLECLGSKGYLINVARGSIVDEKALIEALDHQTIAGAGLDVFTNEPEVPLKLRGLSNVVLSPHMGSSTYENLDNMFQIQADQLNRFKNTVFLASDQITSSA